MAIHFDSTDKKLNEEQIKQLTKEPLGARSKYSTFVFEPIQTLWKESVKGSEQDNYVIFANKLCFHAVLEHNYFVLGARLIASSWTLNKKWKRWKEQLDNSVYNTDLDHAECYKTRNAALRAVARNRKGYVHEPINNPHQATIHGYDIVMTEGKIDHIDD